MILLQAYPPDEGFCGQFDLAFLSAAGFMQAAYKQKADISQPYFLTEYKNSLIMCEKNSIIKNRLCQRASQQRPVKPAFLRRNKGLDKIVVGMSGGVDSAVAALLLKKQGYDVVGVFMNNWDEQDEDGVCCAAEDFDDVKAVCAKLDIPYYSVSFAKEYWDRVFSIFLKEYSAGRTPNPDILCNSEIKFNAFLDFAIKLGSGGIATGHYVRSKKENGIRYLLKGADPGKDQSYFLCGLNQEMLSRAVFPVGGMYKSEVRKLAQEAGLAVSRKKDSTGICFIGERRFREFLKKYIPAAPGEMRTLSGRCMGMHEGAAYYTLGQRHGLGIGGDNDGRPWFVVGKDVKNNILYVEQGEHEALYSRTAYTEAFNWISGIPAAHFRCTARFRYRQSDQPVEVWVQQDGTVRITADDLQRAVTPGQSAVLYDGDICLGGGVVEYTEK